MAAFIVLLNAGAMAWTVYAENWWVLPINIAGMLIGLLMMAGEV